MKLITRIFLFFALSHAVSFSRKLEETVSIINSSGPDTRIGLLISFQKEKRIKIKDELLVKSLNMLEEAVYKCNRCDSLRKSESDKYGPADSNGMVTIRLSDLEPTDKVKEKERDKLIEAWKDEYRFEKISQIFKNEFKVIEIEKWKAEIVKKYCVEPIDLSYPCSDPQRHNIIVLKYIDSRNLEKKFKPRELFWLTIHALMQTTY